MGRIQAVVVLIATVAVIFWRDVLKIVLMVVMLLLIILVAFGAVVIIDGMQHVIK
jgi:hypothetical protein